MVANKTTISRFCGILLFKEEKRKPFVLLLPWRGRLKIPGGMEELSDTLPVDDESGELDSPTRAMYREASEELDARPVNPVPQGDYPDPNDPLNLRAFWSAIEWEGEIRTVQKLIEGEWVDAPVWVEITPELISDLHPRVVYSHLHPLKKGILWVRPKLEAFYYFALNNRITA